MVDHAQASTSLLDRSDMLELLFLCEFWSKVRSTELVSIFAIETSTNFQLSFLGLSCSFTNIHHRGVKGIMGVHKTPLNAVVAVAVLARLGTLTSAISSGNVGLCNPHGM